MPELPEVETARRLIADQALNRRIVAVDDADTYVTRPHIPGQLRDALVGRSLTAARRRGKTIWIETSGLDEPATRGPDLGVHLGMSGSIVVTAPGGEAAQAGEPQPAWRGPVGPGPGNPKWDRFTLEFADGGRAGPVRQAAPGPRPAEP